MFCDKQISQTKQKQERILIWICGNCSSINSVRVNPVLTCIKHCVGPAYKENNKRALVEYLVGLGIICPSINEKPEGQRNRDLLTAKQLRPVVSELEPMFLRAVKNIEIISLVFTICSF